MSLPIPPPPPSSRYTRSIVLLRKCTRLPHIFPDTKLQLPLLSALRLLPIAFSALATTFMLIDPSSYQTGNSLLFTKCPKRTPLLNLIDQQQHNIVSALAGFASFGLMLPFFSRAFVVLRLGPPPPPPTIMRPHLPIFWLWPDEGLQTKNDTKIHFQR